MTEAEWLTSQDLRAMLAYLGVKNGYDSRSVLPLLTPRKARLLAVLGWRLLSPHPDNVLAHALSEKNALAMAESPRAKAGRIPDSLFWVDSESAYHAAYYASVVFSSKDCQRQGADALRDIVGNPWKQSPFRVFKGRLLYTRNEEGSDHMAERCDPHPVQWVTPTVVGIATKIYQSQDFSAMPILADALEDAGCEDEQVLRHCRGWVPCDYCHGTGKVRIKYADAHGDTDTVLCGKCNHDKLMRGRGVRGPDCGWVQPETPAVHVRGCWVVDLILGKS